MIKNSGYWCCSKGEAGWQCRKREADQGCCRSQDGWILLDTMITAIIVGAIGTIMLSMVTLARLQQADGCDAAAIFLAKQELAKSRAQVYQVQKNDLKLERSSMVELNGTRYSLSTEIFPGDGLCTVKAVVRWELRGVEYQREIHCQEAMDG